MARGFFDDEPPRHDANAVRKSELVDISVSIRRETDKAWLVYDGAIEAWIPKFAAECDGKTLTLPERLAHEKGLI